MSDSLYEWSLGRRGVYVEDSAVVSSTAIGWQQHWLQWALLIICIYAYIKTDIYYLLLRALA